MCKLFFSVLLCSATCFVCFSQDSASVKKNKSKPNEYYQWQAINAGYNYALWNNGNHRGKRYELQYDEGFTRWFSFHLTGWYAKGKERDAFISIRPAEGRFIRIDSYSWAGALEPAIGISAFKNKVHDLTLLAGVSIGAYKTEEFRGYFDETVIPFEFKVRQINPVKISAGTNFRLMYKVRIKRFQIGLNLAALSLDNGPSLNQYGLQIGYLLNKPVLNLRNVRCVKKAFGLSNPN